PEEFFAEQKYAPSFISDKRVYHIHRQTKAGDVFFVANPQNTNATVRATFRATGKPEFWYAESGKTRDATQFTSLNAGTTSVIIPLKPTESVFVVFKRDVKPADGITEIKKDGVIISTLKEDGTSSAANNIKILSAKYGPPNDAARTIDVKDKLQKFADENQNDFSVTEMAKPVDPAYMVVKTLTFEYEITRPNEKVPVKHIWKGTDRDTVNFLTFGDEPIAEPVSQGGLAPRITVYQSGEYEVSVVSPAGLPQIAKQTVQLPAPQELTGEWNVKFPKKDLIFDQLTLWNENTDEYIKYFSGTATYTKTFTLDRQQTEQREIFWYFLDLGQCNVIAEVKLNGKDLGTLWTLSKSVDVTDTLKQGENALEIKVTNLWVNRLIGDAKLPDVPERNKDNRLDKFPDWVINGGAIPDGRSTFCMWNLWNGNETPVPSGLIGPVKLVPAKVIEVK
ncbi:MAG: hypothetical protein LBN39_11625, partial [Planctomycetaceae bacterium]|nr:hypothetical protein [Planctomycetaceae bacterium]